MIIRWPGKIAPGTETNHLSAHYDFLATIADLGSVPVPKGKDSLSYLPTLLGKTQEKTHDYVVVNNKFNRMGKSALISNDGWKLVELGKDKYQLYQISSDNEERRDLASKHPKRLKKMIEAIKSELGSQRPDLN